MLTVQVFSLVSSGGGHCRDAAVVHWQACHRLLTATDRSVQDERGRQCKDHRGELVGPGAPRRPCDDRGSRCKINFFGAEALTRAGGGQVTTEKMTRHCQYCTSCGAMKFYESSEAPVQVRPEILVSDGSPGQRWNPGWESRASYAVPDNITTQHNFLDSALIQFTTFLSTLRSLERRSEMGKYGISFWIW